MPLHVVDHPLIRHKTTIMRSKETSTKKFRELVTEITQLLSYEATRSLETTPETIETPLGPCEGASLKQTNIVVAPILRAGLGMVQGMIDMFPRASVAHIGMFRDEETRLPKLYYMSMPDKLEGSAIFVVDPMLATAGSMSAAVDFVKRGKPARVIGLSLIAAPEGRDRMDRDHPDVDIYVAALDSHLNEKAYIVPGLGDAGDRMFGSRKVEIEL
jgi:uracil phosphoribosyltransferase